MLSLVKHNSLFIILACFLATGAHAQQEPPARASASDLINNAQSAVGQVVRAAQSDPAFKPDSAASKPFWDAMKDLNQALDKAQTGLRAVSD